LNSFFREKFSIIETLITKLKCLQFSQFITHHSPPFPTFKAEFDMNCHFIINLHYMAKLAQPSRKLLTTIICTAINSTLTLPYFFLLYHRWTTLFLSDGFLHWMPHEWDKNKKENSKAIYACFAVFCFSSFTSTQPRFLIFF
jgi:hypothetical protein